MEVKAVKLSPKDQIHVDDKTPGGWPSKFCSVAVCGSSRAGKTTWLCNFISNVVRTYSAIIVFSPSISDPIWTSLKRFDDKVFMSQTVSNHILAGVFDKQMRAYREDPGRNHILICIDDYGPLSRLSGNDMSKPLKAIETVSSGIRQMLDVLFSRGRHFGCSVACSFHDLLQPTPLQRVNASHWILYRLSEAQYSKIAQELRCHLSEKEFIQLADKATAKRFHFLYVDLRAPRNEDVFKCISPASAK